MQFLSRLLDSKEKSDVELPQPGRPESEEGRPYSPESQSYYPDIQRPRRKFSSKTRILAYAVVAGTVLAFFWLRARSWRDED